MTRKRFSILFSLFIAVGSALFAQIPEASQQILPKILPKSPEATALARYGTYEVNMYSGVPSISIPLYEIQVGELRVPLTLNYHASGVKVADMASWTGLGWSLSAGGSISRKVMGRPDELQGGYLSGQNPVRLASSIDMFSSSDLSYLKNVVQGYYDLEPDIFSYNMPGKSGKFLFNQANGNSPIILPFDPIEIVRTQIGLSSQRFSIVDESGILYRFDTREWTNDDGNNLVNNSAAHNWLLSNMVSSNKQDTISFTYSPRTGSGTTDVSYSETFVISDETANFTNPPLYQADLGSGTTGVSYSTTTWQVQKEIVYRNGKVVFEQGTEARLDATNGRDAPKRLNAIKIYAYNTSVSGYRLIKTIKFFQSYFVSGIDQSKRLRLDSIGIFDGSETIGMKYRFEYNTSVSLPDFNSKSKDYWGYYNGKNNTTLIPGMSIPYSTTAGSENINIGGSADARYPDPVYMKAYILSKITFPTGGNTQFEFETNQYQENGGTVKYAGGLRVRKIKSFDGLSSIPVVKTYAYGVGETGYGRANFTLSNYFFQSQQTMRYWKSPGLSYCPQILATKRVRTFFSAPTNDIEPYDGVPVGYAAVTEYIGDETNNLGKTVYQYSDQADVLDPVTAFGRPIVNSYHFNRGQLLRKDIYRKNTTGYSMVTSTQNQYEAFPQQWLSNIGLVVFKKFVNQDEYFGNNFCEPEPGNCGCNDSYSYQLGNYSIRAGDNKLIKTTETLYDEDNSSRSLTTITDYLYENFAHQQVTKVVSKNGKGETVTITKKYPHEAISVSPYADMVYNHIYNKVVEESQDNTTLGAAISKTKTVFKNWGSGNYLPELIQTQKGTNAIETRAQFVQYDNRGNILEMRKTNDIGQSYIWDYNQMYVVAEVRNATMSNIAYTSFESNGQGSWTFAGIPFWDGSAPTGKKVYGLSSGSITRQSLNSSTVYRVSYWSKSGVQSVSGSSATTTGRSVNGWTNFEHRVVNPSGGIITVSGTGIIDELRLFPEGAQMITRTYDPLIGISTESDMINRITYYEYDDIGRLTLVRDQDQRVIKKICYGLLGEPENCNIFYNTPKSGVFTRDNCPPNNVGGSVTYAVPANVYSGYTLAIAEAKAQTDVNTNGQAYANSVGTCTATPQTIQGYNAKSFNYRLRMTNVSTGVVYTFTLNANTFSFQNLGNVPTGVYNVQFQPLSTPVTATFRFNSLTFYGTGGALFSNVNVTATSQGYMY